MCAMMIAVFLQDVISAICAPHGNVLRIVIFRKNGVQAMVEYPFAFSLLIFFHNRIYNNNT